MSTAPVPEQKAPDIIYAMGAEGAVTRTDKDSTIIVANVREDGALILVPEWQKFRPAVVRWLNAQDKAPTAIYVEGDEPAPGKPQRQIPPMPKKDLRLGDKTPEVVEWYRRYKPEEFRARYGVVGNGTVTKWRKQPNDKGEMVSVSYEVDATIAARKTHLTERVEANEAQVNEYEEGAS
jgi:hypothetical protein